MTALLLRYQKEVQQELQSILNYWMHRVTDHHNGGFFGQIDFNNQVQEKAPKGVVLHARILWTFSRAYQISSDKNFLTTAQHAFDYLQKHFIDHLNGGVYWTVTYDGQPLDTKKQIYAQAFTIYAYSAYYAVTKESAAIDGAMELLKCLDTYAFDAVYGGYTEAFTREWQPLADLRLSEKDTNAIKSMNTNLHVLEALTALYHVRPGEQLKEKIAALVRVFMNHIIDPVTGHQFLFFDEAWKVIPAIISYGHDIETAWLLQEAAETIADAELIATTKQNAVKMATAVTAALDVDGGLWYEYDPARQHWIKEKHWWPQAEAMVGYFNAWQNSGKDEMLKYSIDAWHFIQQYIIDVKNGEWYWGVDENHLPLKEDKAGLWKCPYHNGRACIEIIERINHIQHHLSTLMKNDE